VKGKENYKILIAEDNSIIRQLLVEILKSFQLENLVLTENGSQAWDRLQRKDIDLLITDWDMPKLNGYELLVKIHDSGDFLETAVVMLTSTSDIAQINKAFSKGIDNYILKPIQRRQLSEVLKAILPFPLPSSSS